MNVKITTSNENNLYIFSFGNQKQIKRFLFLFYSKIKLLCLKYCVHFVKTYINKYINKYINI